MVDFRILTRMKMSIWCHVLPIQLTKLLCFVEAIRTSTETGAQWRRINRGNFPLVHEETFCKVIYSCDGESFYVEITDLSSGVEKNILFL